MVETDTKIIQAVSQELIDIHISMANCKECVHIKTGNKVGCCNTVPTTDTCVILRKYLQT